MNFFLISFTFLMGIAWVTCEEKCGTEMCSEKECCVQMKNQLSCRPFQKENEPCGYPFTCSCEPGLICVEQVFISRCRLAGNMTDIPDKIFIEIDTEFLSPIEGNDAPENLSSTEYVDEIGKNTEEPTAST
uniref:U26-Eretoxin-Ek1b_1 n=1 Tax=Eresus cinnaberinus TaxID=175337 RepID=A0A2D0PBM1_ERECI